MGWTHIFHYFTSRDIDCSCSHYLRGGKLPKRRRFDAYRYLVAEFGPLRATVCGSIGLALQLSQMLRALKTV